MSTVVGPDASHKVTQNRELIDLLRRVGDDFKFEDWTFPPRTAWSVLVEILGTPDFQAFCPLLEELAQSELPPFVVIFILFSSIRNIHSLGRDPDRSSTL